VRGVTPSFAAPSGADTLLIAPQWIGDAVMTQPLLAALHAQGQRLTVGALPWVAPMYRAMAEVSQVIEFPFAHGRLQLSERYQYAKSLRGQFQRAVVCPNSFKSALLPWLAGIDQRVGYRGEARWGLLTHTLPNPPRHDRGSMVAHYLALAGAQLPAAGAQRRPVLQVAADTRIAVLGSWGLHANGYYVFAPGAEYGPAKRWPAQHFAELAGRLDAPVVLLGSAHDAALCDEIVRLTQSARTGSCTSLAGRSGLDESLALVAGARAVVTNDSGLMHIAAALDTPQVALFGSSNPLHTPPLSDVARVLWLKNDASYIPALDCAPCYARSCPLGHTRCLQDLSPQRVAETLKSLL
jgi:heptosyltransferase-2